MSNDTRMALSMLRGDWRDYKIWSGVGESSSRDAPNVILVTQVVVKLGRFSKGHAVLVLRGDHLGV